MGRMYPTFFVAVAVLMALIAAFEKYRAQHIKPAQQHPSAKAFLLRSPFAAGLASRPRTHKSTASIDVRLSSTKPEIRARFTYLMPSKYAP